MKPLSSNRPYLLRAYYDWLMDNELTPHVVIDADIPGTQVPREYVENGQIVFNISPTAIGQLQLSDDRVEFNARFGGIPQQVLLPIASITAIYAKENGVGTLFEPETFEQEEATTDTEMVEISVVDEADKSNKDDKTAVKPAKTKSRSHLTVIK